MTKETVTLEQEQWTQVINILTTAPTPWIVSNPLVQAMVPQLQAQRDATLQPQGNSNGYLNTQRGVAGEPAGWNATEPNFPPGPKGT